MKGSRLPRRPWGISWAPSLSCPARGTTISTGYFCDSCDAENCDAENCAHQAERNSPTWWLKRAYTGSGPVKTDSTKPYKRQAADLRLEAMHQRDRFGRNLLATELEEAAATIEALAEKLEAADNGES